MRVLMLSWEYPPKSVGGLARHVYDLTNALASIRVDIHLITSGGMGAPHFEEINGVRYTGSGPTGIISDFVTWVAQFNVALLRKPYPFGQ